MNVRLLATLRLTFGGQRVMQIALAALIAAALALSLLLPGRSAQKLQILQLTLTGIAVVFWWLLAGSRLLSFAYHARQLRIPRPLAHLPQSLAAGLALTVLLPTLLWTALGSDPWLCLAVLALCACAGLFWASMPPWLMFLALGVGLLSRFLPELPQIHWPTLPAPLYPAALAALLAALTALFWSRVFRRGAPARAWSLPIALALGMIGENVEDQQLRQQQAGWLHQASLSGGVPDGLRHRPRAALSLALGPGFGCSLRTLAVENLWLLGVVGVWLLLYAGKPMEGGNRVGLAFPALMVAFSVSLPALRLWTLYRRPSLGLHELALLPGLAAHGESRAGSLVRVLMRRQAVSLLISLSLMFAYGVLLRAPAGYYTALLWIGAASAMLACWLAMLVTRRRVGGALLLLSGLAAGIAGMLTMTTAVAGNAPGWLLPAWAGACVVLLLLYGFALQALRRLPHPFLAN